MALRKSLTVDIIFIVLCGLAFSTAAQEEVQLGDKSSFCTTWVKSSAGKCPNPPTVNTVNVTAYQGRWYEIGTTAEFKFLSEAGLICNLVNYTINGTVNGQVNIKVVNRGLSRAAFPLQLATIQTGFSVLNLGLRSRAICQRVINGSDLSEAIGKAQVASANLDSSTAQKVSASLLQLTYSLRLISPFSQLIYADVAAIQTAIAAWATYNGTSLAMSQKQILDIVNNILATTDKIIDVSINVSRNAAEIEADVSKSGDAANEVLTQLNLIKQVAGFNGQIASLALRLQRFAKKVQGYVGGVKSQLPPVSIPTAFEGLGVGNPMEAGKLNVTIGDFGGPAPYWIIGLYGDVAKGYDEAIVYSCTDTALRVPQATLFFIARTPTVPQSSLDRFFSLAKSYGIYLGPSNGFIPSVQDRGSCAAYQSGLN